MNASFVGLVLEHKWPDWVTIQPHLKKGLDFGPRELASES